MRRRRATRRVAAWSVLAASAMVGCGPKACSCSGLPKNLLHEETRSKKAFADVDVVSEGGEPRIGLRVSRWTGLRYRLVLEGGGSLALEGQPPTQGPVVTTTMLQEVVRGSTDPIVEGVDGGIVSLVEERSTIQSVAAHQEGAPPNIIENWNLLMRPLVNTTVRQRIGESGAVLSSTAETRGAPAPKEVEALVKQTLDTQKHFPFRLPPVPVGVGAVWRFRDRFDFAGIHTIQLAEMTLRAFDDTTATVHVALRQEAVPQEIPHPFLPGRTARVDQFRGDGEGELRVDRLTAIVRDGHLFGAARITLTGEGEGNKITTVSLAATSLLTAHGEVLTDLPGESADASLAAPSPSPH